MNPTSPQDVEPSTSALESEARRLRDEIYGPQVDPNNWAYCKEAWMQDIVWLRKVAQKKP